jgi:hypothetical protein
MASYEFKLFIPACIGPSCVKYIELYGFPKMVNSLFISQFSMQYLLIFLLSAFILLFVYILARDKKQYFIHRIIFFVLVVFLLSISLKNSAAFFFQYKNKSDIDLVIREIKKIDYLDNIVVYDSILYNMKNGLIVPEYSLGGAATADKGEHRWDAYYLIDRLNVGKKFISNIEDLKSLLQSNNKAKTLILINKNSLKTEDKKESKFLPKAMLEKGDYLMILLN